MVIRYKWKYVNESNRFVTCIEDDGNLKLEEHDELMVLPAKYGDIRQSNTMVLLFKNTSENYRYFGCSLAVG